MWNEEHPFEISSEKEATIEIFDKENVGQDKFMGELKVIGHVGYKLVQSVHIVH